MDGGGILPARGLVAIATVAVFSLPACGGGGSNDPGSSPQDPQVCATDQPITGRALEDIPSDLPLGEWGAVVEVSKRRGYVGAQVISDLTVVELYPEISRAVRAGGYATISGENEGFEAELFFQKGDDTGTFLLRKGPCQGQVTVKLIYGSTPSKSGGA